MPDTTDLSPHLDGNRPLEERTHALNELARYTLASTRGYFRGYSLTYDECEELVGRTWGELTRFILTGRYHDRGIDPAKLVAVFAKHVRQNYFARDRRQNYQDVSLTLVAEDEAFTDREMLGEVETWLDIAERLDAEFPDPEDRSIVNLMMQGYTHTHDLMAALHVSERTIWRRMTRIRPILYPILKMAGMAVPDDE